MKSKMELEDAVKQLLPIREAAEASGLSSSHLRLLVREKKVWGIKLGHNWFTTKAAVTKYLAQSYRPGPK